MAKIKIAKTIEEKFEAHLDFVRMSRSKAPFNPRLLVGHKISLQPSLVRKEKVYPAKNKKSVKNVSCYDINVAYLLSHINSALYISMQYSSTFKNRMRFPLMGNTYNILALKQILQKFYNDNVKTCKFIQTTSRTLTYIIGENNEAYSLLSRVDTNTSIFKLPIYLEDWGGVQKTNNVNNE